jgi:hypothetical protein
MIALLPILKRFAPYLVVIATMLALAAYATHKGYQAGIQHEAPTIAALNATIADVRAKTAQAKVDNLAHVVAVERKNAQVQQEAQNAIEVQRTAARALAADYARRMRDSAEAHPGAGGTSGLSQAANAAGSAAGAGGAAELDEDLRICSDNTVKAAGWQDWYAKVGKQP